MSILPDQPELILTESRTMRAATVYVIQFSSGVLKVGQTSNPKARLADHAKVARAHGHGVEETLISPPHTNYLANERALITFCSARWSLIAGREYFADADIEEVVRFVETLTFTAPTCEQELAAAVAVMQERARRARVLDLAEPFAEQILYAAKTGEPFQFPHRLTPEGGAS